MPNKLSRTDWLLLSFCLITTGISVSGMTPHEKNNSSAFETTSRYQSIAVLDVEQLVLDSQGGASASEWVKTAVTKYCGGSCVVMSKLSVLSGDVIDLNALYRKEVGLTAPIAKLTSEQQKDLSAFLDKTKVKENAFSDSAESEKDTNDSMLFFSTLVQSSNYTTASKVDK